MHKKITLLFILNAFIICSFSQIHKDINVFQADSLISSNSANPNFNILDVRTFDEYSDGHIQDAINIDLTSPDFEIHLDSLNKNDIYLVYCRTGGRSAMAVFLHHGSDDPVGEVDSLSCACLDESGASGNAFRGNNYLR